MKKVRECVGGRCIRQREKETETEIPKQAVCFSKHILLVNFAIRVINANSVLNKNLNFLIKSFETTSESTLCVMDYVSQILSTGKKMPSIKSL